MTLNITRYLSRFADAIACDDVIATDMTGRNQILVLGTPTVIRNLVGERTFVRVWARSLATGQEGEMIYHSSATVYVRTDPTPKRTTP